ncbi:hypothetical protein, partial [Kitasatospora sp. MBT63]
GADPINHTDPTGNIRISAADLMQKRQKMRLGDIYETPAQSGRAEERQLVKRLLAIRSEVPQPPRSLPRADLTLNAHEETLLTAKAARPQTVGANLVVSPVQVTDVPNHLNENGKKFRPTVDVPVFTTYAIPPHRNPADFRMVRFAKASWGIREALSKNFEVKSTVPGYMSFGPTASMGQVPAPAQLAASERTRLVSLVKNNPRQWKYDGPGTEFQPNSTMNRDTPGLLSVGQMSWPMVQNNEFISILIDRRNMELANVLKFEVKYHAMGNVDKRTVDIIYGDA